MTIWYSQTAANSHTGSTTQPADEDQDVNRNRLSLRIEIKFIPACAQTRRHRDKIDIYEAYIYLFSQC